MQFSFAKNEISCIPTGICDIPSKLNDMCPQFELWNSWFGEHQKYDPSSVVESVSDDDFFAKEDEGLPEDEYALAANAVRDVDEVEGGSDAALIEVFDAADDASLDTVAAEGVRSTAGPRSMTASSVNTSPRNVVQSPVHSCTGTKRNSGGAPIGSAAFVVQSAAAAKQALQSVIASPTVAGSSQASSNSSKSSFDAVYAKAAENKVQCLKEIAQTKAECQLKLQMNDQRFQTQRLLLEGKIGNEERRMKQKIEFEKNIANLFVADNTGGLAQNYMLLLRAEEERQRHRVDSADAALDAFAAMNDASHQ